MKTQNIILKHHYFDFFKMKKIWKEQQTAQVVRQKHKRVLKCEKGNLEIAEHFRIGVRRERL